jgi:hypothetical protein
MDAEWALSPLTKRIDRVGAKMDALKFSLGSENSQVEYSFKSSSSRVSQKKEKNSLTRLPLQNIDSNTDALSLSLPLSPFCKSGGSSVGGSSSLSQVNGQADELIPTAQHMNSIAVHIEPSMPVALPSSLFEDMVPWHDFDDLDSSTWLEEDENETSIIEREYTQQKKALSESMNLPPVFLNSSPSGSVAAGGCPQGPHEGDASSSTMDNNDTANCNGNSNSSGNSMLMDNTTDSTVVGEQLYCTDGNKSIGPISQFMVMEPDEEDLFCIDEQGKGPYLNVFSPSRAIGSTKIGNECCTSDDLKAITMKPLTVAFEEGSTFKDLEVCEISCPAPEQVKPKPRFFKVLMAALFPPKARGRGGKGTYHNMGHSRFRHTIMAATASS